ncbi:MAG: hypothetical protein GTN78_20885 [Gemmatimonadales bacterium]|nr:hypothetical protein [Gemmatimonadales bacterium]NIN12948.1 hypothetical protein [Gemmatimonadales bacterium]NIR02623.1 hypothetical protein [Gemmatimonadales bacterium]NIS67199.1 hypothetical protein [Gemmatimonadales bacterium]
MGEPAMKAVVAREAEGRTAIETPAETALRSRFRPSATMWGYLAAVAVMYLSGVAYVVARGLSLRSLFLYGLLQPPGLTGEAARLTEIPTPLSWNVPEVLWFIYIKASAVLVELFQYWAIGMLIAGALIVFVSWEKVKAKMGYGGLKANLQATGAGAVIPICSCGIVPVLAGMVEAGIPLGPTMAFLIAAPMLNVPTVFMTAGVLGWPMALARIVATFGIALTVGEVLSRWQRKHRNPRTFLKIHIPPRLSPELQQFAFRFGMLAATAPDGVRAADMGPDGEARLQVLEEGGIAERTASGRWSLAEVDPAESRNVGACAVLPAGDRTWDSLRQRLSEMLRTAVRLFVQLNGYLLLAVVIAGAIKVVLPTSLVTQWVGGTALNSVLLAAVIAVLAYVCTYVEVPTALALVSRGMGPGATLAYLLGGPGLSLPSIAMLSGVFKPKVLVLYVGVSFVGCIVAGYVFNLFM